MPSSCVISTGLPVAVKDRNGHDLFCQPSRLLGTTSGLLAAQGIGIDLFAGQPILLRQVLGSNRHTTAGVGVFESLL